MSDKDRGAGMNIELKPIAEKKIRQLGGDVCGVLVRKGDKVATVTDMGRVKWLSNSVLWPIANECKSEREAFEGAMAGEAHLKWIPEAGEYSSQITQKMWQTWRCARAGEDPDLQLIEQRDHWEEKATELAEAVGEHFGFQVGEHSSANCPVQNAIDQLDELGGVRAQSGQGAEVVPDFQAEIRTERDFSDEYNNYLAFISGGKSHPYMYIPESLDQEVLDEALRRLNTHPQPAQQGVPDGVWEALQRLIENGGQMGPASREDALLVARHRHYLMTTPQQGGVPEGHVAIPKDVAAAKGMYLVGYSWLKHNAPQELATPQPEGDGRIPDWLYDGYAVYQNLTEEQKTQTSAKNVSDTLDAIVTMIKRQQPPQKGEGDE